MSCLTTKTVYSYVAAEISDFDQIMYSYLSSGRRSWAERVIYSFIGIIHDRFALGRGRAWSDGTCSVLGDGACRGWPVHAGAVQMRAVAGDALPAAIELLNGTAGDCGGAIRVIPTVAVYATRCSDCIIVQCWQCIARCIGHSCDTFPLYFKCSLLYLECLNGANDVGKCIVTNTRSSFIIPSALLRIQYFATAQRRH